MGGDGGSGLVAVRYIPLQIYEISGRVTNAVTGEGMDGVTLQFSDEGGSVTTAGGGYYTRAVPEGWSGTARMVSHLGVPVNRLYSEVTGNISEQDYTVYGVGGSVTSEVVNGIHYGIHIFRENGTFESFLDGLNVEYLVVGGGGAGGRNSNNNNRGGGGGGAGGVCTGIVKCVRGIQNVTVGAGGIRTVNRGGSGGNSAIGGIVAIGGGGGGGASANVSGLSGGSGGGAGNHGGSVGSGTAGQGYAGGAYGGDLNAGGGGGGGGGAMSSGTAAYNQVPGAGGSGLTSTVTGVSVVYGKGGNGGTGVVNSVTVNGVANTGEGGRGNRYADAGNGGSGIVVIRYPLSEFVQVSGRVTQPQSGEGVDGVTLEFSHGGGYAVTTGGGYYSNMVYKGWSGEVGFRSHVAVPWNRSFESLNQSITGQNFVLYGGGGAVTTLVVNGMTYGVHVFKTSGTLTSYIDQWRTEYLVVGGGGAGGRSSQELNRGGGGGGAGGVCTGSIDVTTGGYPVVVGAGGIRSTNRGVSGGNSSFAGITAIGGGGGGGACINENGLAGGSGGGAGNYGTGVGAGTVGQGTAGGNCGGDYQKGGGGGGGGGATSAGGSGGGNGTIHTPGQGGAGRECSITGESIVYGTGGDGGTGNVNSVTVNGVANTGNGGRGNRYADAGNGGSGIVVVRYSLRAPLRVSGRVTQMYTGEGVDGVSIEFSNGGRTVLTAGGGYYTNTISEGWSGTVTPSYSAAGYFTPTSRAYSDVTNDFAGQDYQFMPPPSITAVTPASGDMLGGTTVLLTGANFGASPLPVVTFGGSNAMNVTRINATTLRAVTPGHAAGWVDVRVTNPDGQSGTLAEGFRYLLPSPQLFSVDPISGPATGGVAVVISGTSLRAPWYDAAWQCRRLLKIPRENISGELTNFPVLIQLQEDSLRSGGHGGGVETENGGDIVFTSVDGRTKLNHEIEHYDPETGGLTAWVNVPELSSENNLEMWIYYGNAAAANQWNAADTWNEHFKGVWHFSPNTFNDDFAFFDTNKWEASVGAGGGSATVVDGKLRLAFGQVQGGWGSVSVSSRQAFTGDIDVAIDYSGFSATQYSGLVMDLRFGGNRMAVSRDTGGIGCGFYPSGASSQTYGTSYSASAGRMRLVKSGTTISAYYAAAGSATWTFLRSYTDNRFTGEFRVVIYAADDATGVMQPVFLDNFVVNGQGQQLDSTRYHNHGNNYLSYPADGKILGSRRFDGTNSYVEIPNSATMENIQEGNYTLQAWYRANGLPVGNSINLAGAQGLIIKYGWHLGMYLHEEGMYFRHVLSGNVGVWCAKPVSNALGYNHYVSTVDRAEGSTKLYVNGVLAATNAFTPNAAAREYNQEPWRLGIARPGISEYRFPARGDLDEVRILNKALSAEWITTEHRNQASPETFCTLGVEERNGGESGGIYFGTNGVTVLSVRSNSLVVLLPSHDAGWVDVTVRNPDNQFATLSNAFLYLPVIAGRVTNRVTGAGVEGAVVALSGGAGTAVTAADGAYGLTVNLGWSGTATVSLDPALGAGSFAPATRSYSNVTDTQAGQDYAFVPVNPTITGRVINEDTGEGIEGAGVAFSGGVGSVTTDAGGYYSKTVPYLWSGSATPSHTNVYGAGVFTPGTRGYTNQTASVAGEDFSWKPPYVPGNRYVSLTGLNEHPYTNWVMAARDIQTAVNAAGPGDTIFVADGTYNLSSVITVAKPVTIVSENGPLETIVRRASGKDGVFNLTVTNARLEGFTVREGYAFTDDETAGGVGLNHGAVIRNCIVEENTSMLSERGGGLTLRNGSKAINCVIRNNNGGRWVRNAGGVLLETGSRLINCTVYGNYLMVGGAGGGETIGAGGVWQAQSNTPVYVENCIVRGNSYSLGSYWHEGVVTTHAPDLFSMGRMVARRTCYGSAARVTLEDGCFNQDAGWVGASADLRLREDSVCLNVGNSVYNGEATDLAGNARVSGGAIDLGAYEFANPRPRVMGHVTHEDTGAGMSGVTIGLAGGGAAVTDSQGNYILVAEAGWSGTATPTYGSGVFTNPTARTYSDLTIDVPGQNYIWTPPDPMVSGRVTHQRTGEGLDGVTISFDGLPEVVTAGGGAYSFTVARRSSGTLTPHYAVGGGFSPATRSYTDLRMNQSTQNFVWVPPTRAISGRIVNHYTGAGESGVTVSFSAAGGDSVITDAAGSYTGQVFYGWTGRATPSKTGGVFTPMAYREYSTVTAAQTGQDYVWRPATPVISGRVTNNLTGAGLVGVTVSFSGAGSTATTNGGYYTHVLSYGWSGTATPSYALGVLAPASRTYENLTDNMGVQNFGWAAPERTIAGRVTDGDTGLGLDGLTVGFEPGGGSATTAAGGYYSRTLYYGWAGTSRVSQAGGTMTPSARGYASGLVVNQTGQDFVWRAHRWISGMVTNVDTGAGMDGVTILFSGGADSTVTSNGGTYRHAVPYNWSGTATPSGGGAVYTPSARSFSGVISDRSGENFAYQAPRTISGRVTNHYTGAGVDGIVLGFSGAGNATTVHGGYYSRTVPDGWSGTAVPQGVGVYQPASRTYTSMSADVAGQDYEWTPPNPVVSGRVYHRYTGVGMGGWTVMFSGGLGSVTTDVSGAYSRTMSYGWSGTLSMSCETGSLLPSSRMLSNVTSNQAGQDFAWDPPTVLISGVVTNTDTGLGEEGVSISFSGGLGSTITGTGGGYSQLVYVGWSGTVTVVKAGGTLSPAARSYSNVNAAQANQNYGFTPHRTISGQILMEDTDVGVEGVTVQFSGGAGAVTTDGGGYYSLDVPLGWSGTATAQAGTNVWVYEPVSRSLTHVTGTVPGQDFRVRQQRRITGRVTDLYTGEGVNGIVLSNVTSHAWTSTTGGGAYELRVRNGWSGRIEARHSSGSFVVAGRDYDGVDADLADQNYVWIPPNPVVSGRVTNYYSGAGVGGVAVAFSDGVGVTSAVNGAFSRSVPRGWSGTLTPSRGGETFQPSTRTLTNVLVDVGGQGFGWMASRIVVSGRVTNSITGAGMGGVRIMASGGIGSVETAADGGYELEVDYWWSGTVHPVHAGETFAPVSRSYAAVTNTQAAQDYGWIPPPSEGDRYVSLDGGNVYPFTNWATAATNLQWAINVANSGENIWVAGGTYGVASSITVSKALWVRSVDGAQATVLERSTAFSGDLLHVNHANAKVSGFTLQGGGAGSDGGGAYVQSGYLYNAIVRGHGGAGIVLGDVPTARIANCLVVDNEGAGVSGNGVVVNCTVVGNGEGMAASFVYNTIADTTILADDVRYSLAPGLAGQNNQSGDPMFLDAAGGNYHLRMGSPAIDRGNNFYNTLSEDLEGAPRILNAIDLGVYETKGTEGLSVALMAEPSPVIGGDGMEYVVWAFNSGPGGATGVEVEVGVPAAMSYLGHTAGMEYQLAGRRWSIGNLSAGAHRVLRIGAQTGAAGWVTNVARISAISADPSTPGYDVATNVLEVLGPVQITNVLAGSSSGNATVQWNSVVGQGYDVYVVSNTPMLGVPVSFQKRETGLVVTDNLRDYLDRSLGEGEVQQYYQVSYENRAPETNRFWGVIRKNIAPGFTMLAPPVRTDRRFDGELGKMLAESLTGSASADGDKVFIMTEGGGWRTLWLDASKTWREQDGQPSACVLPEGQGLYVLRSVPASTKVTFRGPVGNDGTGSVTLQPGFNLIGLSEGWKLPLKATLATANPQGGAWEEEADQLVIQNANGSWRFLMFVTNWGAPYDGNWFDLTTYQIVNPSETLDPGAAYYYLRRGPRSNVEF